jgi:uncharacterized iron-regulated membrane protein
LFLFVIVLSGTLAVIGNELDWLSDPAMRASPATSGEASWGRIAANAVQAVPGGHIDLIEKGTSPWFATVVVMQAPDGHRRRVLVDPHTGRVNRVAPFGGAQRFLRDFHRRFMLPVAIGLPLVTSFAFVLLASLVTGLVTYRKFWRGYFRKPRLRDLRTGAGDLHRLAGLWSLWFLALVIATSLWYLVELFGAAAPVLLPLDKPNETGALAQPIGDDLDRLADRVHSVYPRLEITRVQFPFKGVSAIGFQGHSTAILTTEKANAIWLDAKSGVLIRRFEGEQLSAHQRLSEMADPLHFGTWGGYPSKLAWFAIGILLTALSATGAIIYATRLSGGFGGYLRGLSWWGLPAIILIAAALCLTPAILAG